MSVPPWTRAAAAAGLGHDLPAGPSQGGVQVPMLAGQPRLGGAPAVLQGLGDALLHGRGDVAVDAAHAGETVAEAAGLGDFGDAVVDEPGLVGVA